ncbi:uncharacterized protein LOC125752760 isoform X31 [Canis lupus dingo]|uniref:uncharacterized protein LOC125752760 isoform X31 n=1 Tax=Canis lupus dingo TaxID=286419 RepID=UPI0020C4990C|nr:uncharacterized protein LOC125752760 isoform X31 [Canis lupus dingo]
MESQGPQYKEDRELLMDSQETPLHMPSLVMDKPPEHNPLGLEEGDLLSVSPVTLRGTQESHRHTQDPLKVILDLNMESRDPQYKGDRELPIDSQEIQVDMSTLAMVKPPGHNPVGLVEGNLLSVSPVTLRGTQEPHRHTPVPPMVRLDLNIQNWVPQLKGDREHIMDSQKISAHMPTLAMDRPPGHYPVGLVEGNLVAVSPVTLKGTQESHKHTQNPHVLTLDLNIQSQDPHYTGERKLLTDSQETLLDMRTLAMDKPPGHNPVGLVEGKLVAVSPVTLKGTQVSHRHTQDPLVVRLDLNMESQGPQHKEDRELLMDSQETPQDMPSQGMDKPPGHNPVGLEEGDLLSVSPVTLRGTQESHRHTQDPLKVILDLNMESRDPQYKGDRELPRGSQEMQVDMSTLAMVKPPGHNPAGLVEGNLLSVSPVTLRGTQEPHRHTPVPPMVRLDLNIQNWVPQLKGDREHIMDSQKISAHMPTLAMDRPPGHYPVGLVEGNLVAVSPVTLKGTQESHKHTQNPHVLTLDLNIQSQDPHYTGERKLLTDSQETLLDMRTLAMDKPPGHNPVGLVEGKLVAVSPVTLKGTQESHRHTQDPLKVILDLNMESRDPQYKGDRELPRGSQEMQVDMSTLAMVKPPGHNPAGLVEGNLLSVSPVTLRGTQEPHRHTPVPPMVRLDLNIQNWVPQLKGDREHIMDSQKISAHMPTLAMDRPPGHYPVGLVEGNLVAVSPVTLKGTQESHKHTQNPHVLTLDLNIQSQDPHYTGERKLLTDSQETLLDMRTLAMDKPPGHNPVGLVEGKLVAVSPVTLKGTQVSHRHTQDPLVVRLDLNMESQGPQHKEDRELLMDSQETPQDMPSQGMDKPPGHNPVGLEEGDLLSVSPVTLRGTQESHRHTQDPLKVILDLNMESRDPQYKGDRELPIDSQEIQVDMSTLAMVKPPGHNPAGLVEGNLLSVSPVTLRGTQEPHRHTPVPPMVRLDLNIQNWVPQLKGDREHIMDSQKISAHMPTLAMDRPPGHYPVGLVEGNLVAVSPVTLKGTQESHKHTQNPHVLTLDLNIQSQDPHYKGERKLLTDSQETLLDTRTLAMDKPPGHNPVGLVEGKLVAVSPVTLKGTQVSHRHTQDPLVVRLDLNMESQGPQHKEDRELLMDSQETPLHIPSLVMDKPPEHNPVGLEEEDLLSVNPMTLRGT